MSAREYQELLEKAQRLEPDEQLKLLADLASLLRRKGAGRRRSILEFQGLGKEVWENMDAQEYVDRERETWNGTSH